MKKQGDKELTEAKKAYLQTLKIRRSGDAQLAALLGQMLEIGRTFMFYTELEKKIDALTPEQVTAAFKKHIEGKRLVIVKAGDFKGK